MGRWWIIIIMLFRPRVFASRLSKCFWESLLLRSNVVGSRFAGFHDFYIISPTEAKAASKVNVGDDISVLGRVGSVGKQPSSQSKLGDDDRKKEQNSQLSIISGPNQEQQTAQEVSGTTQRDGVSQETREYSPVKDNESKETHLNSGKDCKKVKEIN